MNKQKAVVTGVTGQTGSFMCELLLEEGMQVYGLHRRNTQNTFDNLKAVIDHPNFYMLESDLLDFTSISSTIFGLQPDYFFNYAAQSHVHSSFEQPLNTLNINTVAVTNILESIRKFSPLTKMLQASSSEQFGNNYRIKYKDEASMEDDMPLDEKIKAGKAKKIQDEIVEFKPRSPYAVSKLAAHEMCYTYREAYGLYVVCSICFNHESPRRGKQFVTRKITNWIAKHHFPHLINNAPIKNQDKLRLGNINSQRDWGHAKDYCRAMRAMMEMSKPQDLVICTGKTHSIREFLNVAFKHFNITDWEKYVEIDPKLFRPAEVDYLRGDNSLLKSKISWEPEYDLQKLVTEMIESDLKCLSPL